MEKKFAYNVCSWAALKGRRRSKYMYKKKLPQ